MGTQEVWFLHSISPEISLLFRAGGQAGMAAGYPPPLPPLIPPLSSLKRETAGFLNTSSISQCVLHFHFPHQKPKHNLSLSRPLSLPLSHYNEPVH